MYARVTFTKATLQQEGTVGKILKWIQDNPNFVRSTNITLLSNVIANNNGMKSNTVKINLQKMVNNQMLTRFGGKRHARFMINYYHKDMPGYILERAPQDIQDKVKAMKDNLQKDQHIDEVGCVVTEGNKEVKEVEEEVKEEPKEEEQQVVVPVKVEKDGQAMNITITLNLNLNR